jgi:hypothetical protein
MRRLAAASCEESSWTMSRTRTLVSGASIYLLNQRQGFMSSTLSRLSPGALSMPAKSMMNSDLARTMIVPCGIADQTSHGPGFALTRAQSR